MIVKKKNKSFADLSQQELCECYIKYTSAQQQFLISQIL